MRGTVAILLCGDNYVLLSKSMLAPCLIILMCISNPILFLTPRRNGMCFVGCSFMLKMCTSYCQWERLCISA